MYLDYEDHKAGVYVIDIETDGLNPKVIWVMCTRNVLTDETEEFTDNEDMEEWFEDHEECLFIGHNILGFDAPVLNRLLELPFKLDASNCIDTLVLSTLYSPSISGGHSLDAWGQRLKERKTEFNDWSKLSQEMIDYCHQDTKVTSILLKKLARVLKKLEFKESAIWLQHNITEVIRKQQKNGFKFNGQEAIALYSSLRQREETLQEEIREAFPAEKTLVAERPMYTKSGRPTAIYLKDKDRYTLDECQQSGTYKAFDYVEFNLGSPKQRANKLVSLGWEPKEFTPSGLPKPFDKGRLSESLEKFLEDNPTPQVNLIATWMAVNGRANMINTWLENWNEQTGCIHGKLFTADTLRFRHQSPNTANIPAVRMSKDGMGVLRGESGFWTYEARDLWIARQGRVLVGTDASGLELRMLAHYLNDPEFTKQVVEGDPHQYNADLAGITRPEAKTLIYATLYGAGDAKIGVTLGVPLKEASEIKRVFLEKLGADKLIEECKHEQRNGRVSLCDGSQVVCPSPHAALNYKLQGGGARVMALGAVLLEKTIRREELDSLKVGDIHDEWQYDVHPDDAESHSNASVQAIRDAGKHLRLNVPLDASAQVGLTWAETH